MILIDDEVEKEGVIYRRSYKKTIQIYLQIGKTYKLGRTVIVTR